MNRACRAILNFGPYTLATPLKAGMELRPVAAHGEAVAAGMVMAFHAVAQRLGLVDGFCARLTALI